jgi:hypothetical protein
MKQPYFIRLYDGNEYLDMGLVMAFDRQEAHRKATNRFEPGEGQSVGILSLAKLVEETQNRGLITF